MSKGPVYARMSSNGPSAGDLMTDTSGATEANAYRLSGRQQQQQPHYNDTYAGPDHTSHHHQQQHQHGNGRFVRSGSGPVGSTYAATENQPSLDSMHSQGSLVLGQYRRHSASMSAAPIRGAAFASLDSEDDLSKKTRSSSWAPDSPKKARAYKQFGEGKDGRVWDCVRRVSETGVFNRKVLRRNRAEFALWFMLVALTVVGYKFFSDGSFSAILTLASAFQCFSFLLLNVKVLGQQSVAGVSQRSLLLFIVSLVFRLVSTLFFNGYLPVDRSGDWVYQSADVLSVGLIVALLALTRRYCRTSIQQQQDKDTCNIAIPLVVSAVLAICIHPTLNQWAPADIAWTFALYVETFAMVPQLFMMAKIGGEVEALTSHYVASMAASKVFAFLFWYFSYAELAPRRGGRNIAGWAVILSYSAQTILFADFLYYYFSSLKVGKRMILNF